MWVCAGAAQNECSKSPSPGTQSALRSAKAEPIARVTASRVETPGPEPCSHRLCSLKGQPRRGPPARVPRGIWKLPQSQAGPHPGTPAPAAAFPHLKSSSTEASKIEGRQNCGMRSSKIPAPVFGRGQRKGGEVFRGVPWRHGCITKEEGRAGQDLSHQWWVQVTSSWCDQWPINRSSQKSANVRVIEPPVTFLTS